MALAALAFALSACGGGEEQSQTDQEATPSDTQQMETAAGDAEEAAGSAPEELVDMANQVCPVCGMHAHGENFVAYDGKKINVCSEKCAEAFKADPEKFMAQLMEGGSPEGQ
jgi:YHS domain-containing protein